MAVGPTNKCWVKEKGGEQRRQGFVQKGFRTRGGMGKCMLAMHKCATDFGSRPWAEEHACNEQMWKQNLLLNYGQKYMLVMNKCGNRIWFSTMGGSACSTVHA
jgi:hypothetical protein